jgi:DNA-binding Lrp family transcriptional regulator
MSKAIKNLGAGITRQLTKQVKHKYDQTSDNYWLRGAIQIIPAIGGTLDTWFFQFAEKEKQRRVDQSLSKLSRRINQLEEYIDVKHIEANIEEYAYLFEKFLRYVSQEYREELRTKFANVMSNLTTRTYSQQKNKDVYLSKLSEITPDHLVTLQLAYDYSFVDGKQDHEKTKDVKRHIVSKLKENGLDEALIFALLNDLQSKGLMNEVYHPTFGGGLYTNHVTALGVRMLDLVK